jgi:hypothetical protein
MKKEGEEFFSPEDKHVSKKIEELNNSSLEEIMDYFQNERKEIENANAIAQQKAHRYKFMMKQVFGVCDGEQVDIYSLLQAFFKHMVR